MKLIEYPSQHLRLVNDLLEGKFLLYSDDKFPILKANIEFYQDFFEKTFGYELKLRNEFAYLMSEKTDEKFSTKCTIFLFVICYELNQKTKDFKTHLEKSVFSLEEILDFLQHSTFNDLVTRYLFEKTDNLDKIEIFLKELARRNIIYFTDKSEGKFKFTGAIDLFFEVSIELMKKQEKVSNDFDKIQLGEN